MHFRKQYKSLFVLHFNNTDNITTQHNTTVEFYETTLNRKGVYLWCEKLYILYRKIHTQFNVVNYSHSLSWLFLFRMHENNALVVWELRILTNNYFNVTIRENFVKLRSVLLCNCEIWTLTKDKMNKTEAFEI